MPIDLSVGFLVNIQINANDIITLKELCTEMTTILDLKTIILKERNLNDLSSIVLKYNDITMENDKTLNDYEITDSRHIIKLIFSVKESTHTGPVKKYSFVKDRGASDNLFDANNSMNVSVNTDFAVLPSYAQPREPNCCERFRDGCIDCCEDCMDDCMDDFCTRECGVIILFVLFWLGFVAINIGHCVALGKQYDIYREYMDTSTTEMINYYCNNNANEFKRNIGNDLLHGFAINTTFISLPVVAFILLLIIFVSFECLDWCRKNVSLETEDTIAGCCGAFFGFSILTFHVAMIVYNSIILWEDITKIKKYCDPTTDFYQKMIVKWSIWNYMNTFVTYMAIPCICCIYIAGEIYLW